MELPKSEIDGVVDAIAETVFAPLQAEPLAYDTRPIGEERFDPLGEVISDDPRAILPKTAFRTQILQSIAMACEGMSEDGLLTLTSVANDQLDDIYKNYQDAFHTRKEQMEAESDREARGESPISRFIRQLCEYLTNLLRKTAVQIADDKLKDQLRGIAESVTPEKIEEAAKRNAEKIEALKAGIDPHAPKALDTETRSRSDSVSSRGSTVSASSGSIASVDPELLAEATRIGSPAKAAMAQTSGKTDDSASLLGNSSRSSSRGRGGR